MNYVITRKVENRSLVLALDKLYRDRMKVFEIERLLPASQTLVKQLSLSVVDVPIEGYYIESKELTEYFLNIRTLQEQDIVEKQKVIHLESYNLLYEVMSSEIYGLQGQNKFFPQRFDSLYFALDTTHPSDWKVKKLTEKAHNFSIEKNDISLVGIAAFIKDSVVLTALRESVVLYGAIAAASGFMMDTPIYKYVWDVEKELENKVNQFIKSFNALTSSKILKACSATAEYFYEAYIDNDIFGRCVRIGFDDSKYPVDNYHWAINQENDNMTVDEFWSTEVWTTERYQNEKIYI